MNETTIYIPVKQKSDSSIVYGCKVYRGAIKDMQEKCKVSVEDRYQYFKEGMPLEDIFLELHA